MSAEIIVVGGGFVGQAFAIAAGRQDLQVELYERKTRPVMPAALSANVIAVNPASRRFLEQLAVWQRIPAKFVTPYRGMAVYDATGTGEIAFSAEEAGLDELGHIVDQLALLAALAEAAADCPGLSCHWASDLQDELPQASLLVAADGAHSRLREQLGIRKLGFSYKQQATVTVATLSGNHGNVARQWFHQAGPVALLPLSEPDQVAVVWSSFEPLTEISDADFRARLESATEGLHGTIIDTGPRFSFPLMQQHALRYVKPGFALLGDAAHTIHPLAGQGANLGLADARILAQETAAARIEGKSVGDIGILKRFERKRQPENNLVALAMEGFHRLFTSPLPLVGLLRNQGLRLVNENKSLKQLAISVATGRV